MDNTVIFFKGIISFVFFISGLIFFFLIKRIKLDTKRQKEVLFFLLILSRVILFLFVFVIIGQKPQSDLPAYYYPQAKNVLKGLLPYKDFITSYSPLFPYFTAIPLIIYDSVKSIVFFSIIIELLSVFFWYKISLKNLGEITSNNILLIYTFNPIPIILVAISGQNQIWLSLFLGLTFYLILKEKHYFAGLCFALGFLVTKFLILIFLLPLIFFYKNIKNFLLGFLTPVIIIYSGLLIFGFDFLIPIKIEGNDFTSGNIIYLFSTFFPSLINQSLILNLILLAIVICFLIYLNIHKNLHLRSADDIMSLINIANLVFIILLLVSKKSYTNYLTIMLYPIIMSFININNIKRDFVFFSLFGFISVLEPSLWFRIMHQQTLNILFKPSLIYVMPVYIILFICIEIILIFFYLFIFKELYLKLKNRKFFS